MCELINSVSQKQTLSYTSEKDLTLRWTDKSLIGFRIGTMVRRGQSDFDRDHNYITLRSRQRAPKGQMQSRWQIRGAKQGNYTRDLSTGCPIVTQVKRPGNLKCPLLYSPLNMGPAPCCLPSSPPLSSGKKVPA